MADPGEQHVESQLHLAISTLLYKMFRPNPCMRSTSVSAALVVTASDYTLPIAP